jgi:hypothetical protein
MDPYAVKDPKMKMLSSCTHAPRGGVHACMLSPSQPALSSGLYCKYLQARPEERPSEKEGACMYARASSHHELRATISSLVLVLPFSPTKE